MHAYTERIALCNIDVLGANTTVHFALARIRRGFGYVCCHEEAILHSDGFRMRQLLHPINCF